MAPAKAPVKDTVAVTANIPRSHAPAWERTTDAPRSSFFRFARFWMGEVKSSPLVPMRHVSIEEYTDHEHILHKCFTIIRFEVAIAPTGSKVKCSGCGSTFTIYPSKTVISDFWAYVIGNSDVSVRACSMIRNYVHDVDVFLRSSREDFLGLWNCGLETTNELMQFQRELRKKLGLRRGAK